MFGVDGFEEGAGCGAAEFLEVHVHTGQLGAGAGGEDVPVVEAHDGHVLGDAAAAFPQRVEHAAGHLVGAAEDRVDLGLAVEEHPGGGPAPALFPGAVGDFADEGESGRFEGGLRPGRAVAGGAVLAVAADVGDPGAAAGDEVLDGHPAGVHVVRHDREVVGRFGRRVRVHDGHVHGVGQRRARVGRGAHHDEAVHAAAQQGLHVVALADRVAARVAQEHRDLASAERVLRAHEDREAEAAHQVRGEEPDGARAPGEQAPGERVGGEGELRGGLQHALAGLGVHVVAAVERLRGRRHRDARQAGHIGQRGGARAARCGGSGHSSSFSRSPAGFRPGWLDCSRPAESLPNRLSVRVPVGIHGNQCIDIAVP